VEYVVTILRIAADFFHRTDEQIAGHRLRWFFLPSDRIKHITGVVQTSALDKKPALLPVTLHARGFLPQKASFNDRQWRWRLKSVLNTHILHRICDRISNRNGRHANIRGFTRLVTSLAAAHASHSAAAAEAHQEYHNYNCGYGLYCEGFVT
jgi:hypothetical protein